jgi:putative transposase
MPWGLTRYHHIGQTHFVTFCCCHRDPTFTIDASRRVFENALERVRRYFRLRVYGYVVMPDPVRSGQRTRARHPSVTRQTDRHL